MTLPHIKDVSNLKGRRVLVRATLNVPLDGEAVRDDFRIKKILPTLQFLKDAGAKVIVVSHASADGQSLAAAVRELATHIPATFYEGSVKDTTTLAKTFTLGEGEIIVLENLRFDDGEKNNDATFAHALAALGDIFVADDFSVMHREHASVISVPHLLPSYAGFLVHDEVEHLLRALTPTHPFFFLLGGAKISTKEPLIGQFIDRADNLFVGGALANDFYAAMGYSVGASLVDHEADPSPFLNNECIALPSDVVVDDHSVVTPDAVKKHQKILDAGPASIEEIKRLVAQAKLIVWNGPLGDFEHGFGTATEEVAMAIAESSAETIVGGGDTIASVAHLDILDKFGFVSTGGGAMLDFLAKGGTLPGLIALEKE